MNDSAEVGASSDWLLPRWKPARAVAAACSIAAWIIVARLPVRPEPRADLDDMLKERLATLKAERDRAKAALDRTHAAERPSATIAPELIEAFGMLMRRNITEGTIPFRKAWLRSIVGRTDADTVCIIGDKVNLEKVIAATTSGSLKEPGIRSSLRK